MERQEAANSYLHDKLPVSRQSLLHNEAVVGFAFLLRLLDLNEATDWVDAHAVVWGSLLQLVTETQERHFSEQPAKDDKSRSFMITDALAAIKMG